jgi:phage recombination protein Bet
MSTAIARYDDTAWQQKLEAFRAAYASNLTNAELAIFGDACRRLGLDPAAKQIYVFKDSKGKVTTMVAIDGYRSVAENTHQYDGQVGPFWCGADGVWKDVWLSDTPPVAAKVGIRRRDFSEIMWGVARFKAFVRDTDTWRKMPEVMLAIRAEMQALRKTFPNQLGGTYTPGEIDDSDQQNYVEATVEEAPRASEEPRQLTNGIHDRDRSANNASPADDLSIGEFVRGGAQLGMNSKQMAERLGIPQQDFHKINRRAALEKLAGVVPERADKSDEAQDDNDHLPDEADTLEFVLEDHSQDAKDADVAQDAPVEEEKPFNHLGDLVFRKLCSAAGLKTVGAVEDFLSATLGEPPYDREQAIAKVKRAKESAERTPDLKTLPAKAVH